MAGSLEKINLGNFQNTVPTRTVAPVQSAVTADVQGMPFNPNYFAAIKAMAYSNFYKMQNPLDKQAYSALFSSLDQEGQINLEKLMATGKLLSNNSSDGSTTMQNLYKIAFEPKVSGLDNRAILGETIKTLANPFIINQKFGKIPDFATPALLANEQRNAVMGGMGLNPALAPQYNQAKYAGPMVAVNPQDINVTASGTCVAASTEFNLADKKPAEFARYVAGLTSPNMAVKTNVKLSNIKPNVQEAIGLLNSSGAKYRLTSPDSAEVLLSPDRNAIIRARVQQSYRQPGSRSSIDTLLQSTFMQLGSANGYNSLIDKRQGDSVPDNKGLLEGEKNFLESIVDNPASKDSLVYQNVESNDNGSFLKGYNYNFDVTQKHLIDSLNMGCNVIAGIVQTDENNKIVGGHEITILKPEYKNGELYFSYNDTDDDDAKPVEISAKELIPMIHHAGIPRKVANPQAASAMPFTPQVMQPFNQPVNNYLPYIPQYMPPANNYMQQQYMPYGIPQQFPN